MGKKITTYNQDASLSVNDKFLGTDSATGDTKNFRILEVLELIEDVASDTTYYKVIPDTFDFENIPVGYNNAVWVIRNSHDLGGATITLPSNVTLKHEGGVISNGTINFNDTLIDCEDRLFFSSITIGTGGIINDKIKVAWFGAVGDDFTDNTAVFNAVSTYLTFRGGGTMSIGEGIYLMSDVFIKGQVTLEGSGHGCIIKAYSAPTQGILNMINPEAGIYNVIVDGNNIANIGIRIYNNNAQGSFVRKCYIKNCNTYSLEVNDVNIVRIEDNWFEQTVLLDGADTSIFHSNVLQDFSGTALKIQVSTANKSAHNLIVSGNWFETLTGSGFTTAIHVDAYDVTITDNHFHLPYTGLIQSILVDANSDRCRILNNNFQTTGAGKQLIINSGATNTFVMANRTINNTAQYTDNGTDTYIFDGRLVNSNTIDYRVLGSNVTELLLDIDNQKIQFGSDANNYFGKSGADMAMSSAVNLILNALGSSVKFNIGGNELFELNANTNVAIINSNTTTLKEYGQLKSFEFDNVNEKVTIGSVSANDYLGKNAADIELSANSRAIITSNGTQLILRSLGINGYISPQNPIAVKYYATVSLPDPTLYPEGTIVFDSTIDKLKRTNGTSWDIVGHTPVAAHADSVAADVATLVSDFNGLLAKMRTSGILST